MEMFRKEPGAKQKIIILKKKKPRNPQQIESSAQLKRNKLSLCS